MSDDDDDAEEVPAPKVERAVPRRATAAKAAEAASKYAKDSEGSDESEEDMSCDDVGACNAPG